MPQRLDATVNVRGLDLPAHAEEDHGVKGYYFDRHGVAHVAFTDGREEQIPAEKVEEWFKSRDLPYQRD